MDRPPSPCGHIRSQHRQRCVSPRRPTLRVSYLPGYRPGSTHVGHCTGDVAPRPFATARFRAAILCPVLPDDRSARRAWRGRCQSNLCAIALRFLQMTLISCLSVPPDVLAERDRRGNSTTDCTSQQLAGVLLNCSTTTLSC